MEKRIVVQIYAYALCFFCVVTISLSLYSFLKSSLSIAFPEYMNAEKLSNEYNCRCAYDIEKNQCASNEQLGTTVAETRDSKISAIKSSDIKNIIECLLTIILSAVIFLIHWKIGSNNYKKN
jgi:hypothetical protein